LEIYNVGKTGKALT